MEKRALIHRKMGLNLYLAIFAFFVVLTQVDASTHRDRIDSLTNYAAFISSSNHNKAIAICDSVLELCKYYSYDKGEAEVLRIKGLALFYKVNYTDALKHYIASKEKYEKLNDSIGVAFANNNIAIVYDYLGFKEKSIVLHKENLKLRQIIKDTIGISTTLNNIGVIYRHQNKPDKALEYYKKAIDLELVNNDSNSIARYFNNIGLVFLDLQKPDSAIYYFNKSLEIRILINERQGIKNTYQAIGSYYYDIGQYNKAREYQEKSFEIANEIAIVYEIESITADLALTYSQLSMYKEAYEVSAINRRMMDSVKVNETAELITKIEMEKAFAIENKIRELEAEKSETEKNILLHTEKNQKVILFIITIFLVIIILVVLFSLYNKRQQNRLLLKQQEEIFRQQEELTVQRDSILEQNETLQKINSEKDKFFSIIAHDLKSPFAGFLGLTKIISEEYDKLSFAQLQEYSQNLKESAINLYKLLENLLEWSRVQRGVMDFNPELCVLDYVVNQNINIQNIVARQKEISLINNMNDDISAFVDIPMLNTIIRNLLSNAIKFTPRGGRIEIGAQILDNSDNQASMVEVYVKDSGIGMNQDMISNLFKINEKVSKPGTENEPSSGLGLLLCKEFVELNSGIMKVESTEGAGSIFSFTLPTTEIA